jgi:hypothetical protein
MMFELIAAAGEPGSPASEWRRVISMANEACHGMFGRPTDLGRGAEGHFEEYPHARILHSGDGLVHFVAKTAEGDAALREVARRLEA